MSEKNSCTKITFSAPAEITVKVNQIMQRLGLGNNRSAALCVIITRMYEQMFGDQKSHQVEALQARLEAVEKIAERRFGTKR